MGFKLSCFRVALFIFFLVLQINNSIAQLPFIDRTILKDKKEVIELKRSRVTYIYKNRNAFVKYNPVSLLFGGGLYFYQKVISSQIQAGCAFDVSCSNFSKQSIKQFNLVKGIALSADRLTRCTRISAIDFHPVMINNDGKCIDHPDYYMLTE